MEDFHIDLNRAREVVSRLFKAYTDGHGIFADNKELVENQIPQGVKPLSREHALFIFYLVPQDYATKSSALYERAKKLFTEMPELFNPEYVVTLNIENLVKLVAERLGTRFPNETAKRWLLNSQKLLDEYEGDPRKLFSVSHDATVVLKELQSFRGLGPKTGGLLLRAIAGLGFAELTNLEDVLIPVDVHDTRIAFYTQSIQGAQDISTYVGNYQKYVRIIQHLWLNACRDAKVNWLTVDRALWLLGSKGCLNRKCAACPLLNLCVVGKRVVGEANLSLPL